MTTEVPTSNLTYKGNGLTYFGATPFSGVAYSENDEGRREEETSYIDGLRCGLAREWNHDGTLVKEAMYGWDVFHGTARTWHDNGQLERDGEYEYGIALRERLWDEKGNLLSDYVLSKDDGQYEFLERLREIYREDNNDGGDDADSKQI